MSKARDLANVISGTGTISVDAVPALPTSKITSGTFANARLSSGSVTQHVDLTSLSADNLTSGTVPSARLSLGASDIPNLSADKITADSFNADRIPALATSKITSGTFADARLSSSSVTQHVDLTALSASNLTSGTIPNDRYGTPTFSAANLTSLPAPSSANVGSATAGLAVGAVGTYGFLHKTYSGTQEFAGNTTTSSGLVWACANGKQSSGPSGTWKNYGYYYNGGQEGKSTLWLRLS